MKKISKGKLLLLLIIYITLYNYTKSEFLEDSEEKKLKRLEWNRSYQEQISGGKLIFEESAEKGTFCKAKKDLFSNEFVLKIPSKFIISGCK